MRIITWDLEIAESIESKPDGWAAARRGDCGLASLVLYDTESGRNHVYDRRTLDSALEHLALADLLVGFNDIAFDDPCLNGVARIDGSLLRVRPKARFDICDQIWKAVGKRHKGWGLGPTSERTLGIGKAGTGEHAPVLYQQGRHAELIDYNIADVWLTRRLFNHIVEHGFVVAPDGERLHLIAPEGGNLA